MSKASHQGDIYVVYYMSTYIKFKKCMTKLKILLKQTVYSHPLVVADWMLVEYRTHPCIFWYWVGVGDKKNYYFRLLKVCRWKLKINLNNIIKKHVLTSQEWSWRYYSINWVVQNKIIVVQSKTWRKTKTVF